MNNKQFAMLYSEPIATKSIKDLLLSFNSGIKRYVDKEVYGRMYLLNGYLSVTDGFSIIATKNNYKYVVDSGGKHGELEKATNVTANHEDRFIGVKSYIMYSELERAIKDHDVAQYRTFTSCDECNGEGEVQWEYNEYVNDDACPVCNGSGQLQKGDVKYVKLEDTDTIEIGTTEFNSIYLPSNYMFKLYQYAKLFRNNKIYVNMKVNKGQAVFFMLRDGKRAYYIGIAPRVEKSISQRTNISLYIHNNEKNTKR